VKLYYGSVLKGYSKLKKEGVLELSLALTSCECGNIWCIATKRNLGISYFWKAAADPYNYGYIKDVTELSKHTGETEKTES